MSEKCALPKHAPRVLDADAVPVLPIDVVNQIIMFAAYSPVCGLIRASRFFGKAFPFMQLGSSPVTIYSLPIYQSLDGWGHFDGRQWSRRFSLCNMVFTNYEMKHHEMWSEPIYFFQRWLSSMMLIADEEGGVTDTETCSGHDSDSGDEDSW